MDPTGRRPRLENFTSADTSASRPRHESQSWSWTFCWWTSTTHICLVFLHPVSVYMPTSVLFICHYWNHFPRVTLSHARLHIANAELVPGPHQGAYFQYIDLFNAVLAKDLLSRTSGNQIPLIKWVGICNIFILNYACFCLQGFFLLCFVFFFYYCESTNKSLLLISICLLINFVIWFHCKFRFLTSFHVVKLDWGAKHMKSHPQTPVKDS